MKGQMFLIAAAVIVTILVLLKSSINIPDILQKKRELEGRFEEKIFLNLVNEFPRVIEFSSYNPEKITDNVFDFGKFIRKKMTERLLNFEFLYVDSLVNVTNNQTNVTLINLLSKPINATLDWNGTSFNCILSDGESCNANFSFEPGKTYILTVSYNETYTQGITIVTQNSKDMYVGFFDITLTGSEMTYRDKFQKNYTLPMLVVVTTTTSTSSSSTTTTISGGISPQ